MAVILEKKSRKVIPRWRSFRATAALGELSSRGLPPKLLVSPEHFFARKLADWRERKTLWHATDLLGAALVLGRQLDATEAAKFVLSEDSGASTPARDIARRILTPGDVVEDESITYSTYNREVVSKRVRVLRLLSQEQPHNPIVWMDLALSYSTVGELRKADRAVKVAVSLAPVNRFILRSAARFYVHIDDPEYAFRLLRDSEATREDPWLLAAEIAVGSAAGLGPRSIRPARQILQEHSNAPKHVTELASALATLELESGKHGSARKLFRTALVAPTENTVAQVEWASKHMTGLDIEVDRFKVPRLFEAKAWESFAKGAWQKAIDDSLDWYADQPFSSRPAELSSYLVVTILEDYKEAERLLRDALKANHSDPTLLNNLAFAYANEGRVDQAEETLARICPGDRTGITEVVIVATRGFMQFRRGLPDIGRKLYNEAIQRAAKLSIKKVKAMAALYLAREEILAKTPHASQAVKKAFALSQKLNDMDVLFVAEKVAKLWKTHAPGIL